MRILQFFSLLVTVVHAFVIGIEEDPEDTHSEESSTDHQQNWSL